MSFDGRPEERRSTVRLQVDSMLLYRAVGMDNFKICMVLTVSIRALEILSERSIPLNTVVAIRVESDESPKQFYRVYGTVIKREQQEGGWKHIIIASPEYPWSPKFLFDVLCSTHESAYEFSIYRREMYAELKSLEANLDAWEARIHLGNTQYRVDRPGAPCQKQAPKVVALPPSRQVDRAGDVAQMAPLTKLEALGCSQLLAYGMWRVLVALRKYGKSDLLGPPKILPKE